MLAEQTLFDLGSAESIADPSASKQYHSRLQEVEQLTMELECHYGDVKLVQQLKPYINDEKWEVRAAVADALVYIGEAELIPFMELLKDRNSFVVNQARRSLTRRDICTSGREKEKKIENRMFKSLSQFQDKVGTEGVQMVRRDLKTVYEETVGHAAHDIRGILSPLLSDIKHIQRLGEFLPAKQMVMLNQCVNRVNERADMILRLLNDMQNFTRQTPDVRMTENLKTLVLNAVQLVREEFAGKDRDISGIEIKVEEFPADINVSVVRELMILVFRNLIKNAVESYLIGVNKFASTGLIEIKAQPLLDGARITIRDYGMGMSPTMLKKVRMFLPRSTSKKATGSGFGTAIAYEKIVDHGGTLNIDSKENEGTLVTVFLPTQGSKENG